MATLFQKRLPVMVFNTISHHSNRHITTLAVSTNTLWKVPSFDSYPFTRHFSKKIQLNKKKVMEDMRAKYDRSDLEKDHHVEVPFERLDISCVRSSGPGGQNVNKVATKVEVRIDLKSCNWIPVEVIERLKVKERGRINNQDEFILVCDTHRTQYDNRNEANRRLQEIIDNCCYPERERLDSSKPKEFEELQKQEKQFKKFKSKSKRVF